VLVPSSKVTGIGSAIFAFLAAGTFRSIDEAQKKVCPSYTVFEPETEAQTTYEELYGLYRKIYFEFGQPGKDSAFGEVLPSLIAISRSHLQK
jgi:L-ribulokinase